MAEGKLFVMGIKSAVILSIILVSVMFTIINLIVPEGNLHSVLNGFATGITVLVVNLFSHKSKNK